VEHLRGPDGGLHPVQQAMVDHHGSQCGFCTPGFVMALFALHHGGGEVTREAATEALAGNLCRCTGSRPIVDAAVASCAAPPQDGFVAAAAGTAAALRVLDDGAGLALEAPGQRYFAPTSLDALAALRLEYPDAVLLAGGTDLGLRVTKRHEVLETVISLEKVAALREVSWQGDVVRLGAGLTYAEALPTLARLHPDFAALVRRIGAGQVRERGTLGGNLGNASPIGDTPPALLALGATLVLRCGPAQRRLPLEQFFLAYRQTTLAPGEFIEAIEVSQPAPGALVRIFKVAKRFDQDISTCCGAFHLRVVDGVVREARLAWGGMAAVPCRSPKAEAALVGQAWGEAAVRAAMAVLGEELRPLSDFRGSAAYRLKVAQNLLLKLWLGEGA
jgi:xanthine dehydrogenase small subunit